MAKNKKKEELETIPEDNLDFGKILAAWSIPEFTKQSKSKKWFLYFGVVIIGLLIYAFFSGNLLFGIIIVFFALIYWLLEKREAGDLDFGLAEDGVIIGQKFVEYKIIENFYIIYQPPKIKNLYLEPKNILKPTIVIPLLNQNPVEIRKILLDYLPEDIEKEEISASESIGEILKL
jgi:hypothetical protein